MRDSLLLLCLLGIGALVADSAEVINLKKTLNEISRYVVAETSQFIEPEMVQLPNGSWMGKYEVTKGQFAAFVTDSKYQTEAESGDGCYGWTGSTWEKDTKYNWRNLGFNQTDDHPVACVSWNDAQAYIKWLNGKTNKNYRLPTEEEWFAACQAGAKPEMEYCGSNNLDEVAWYDGNSGNTTHPVGQKTANAWGLKDMSGNVWEWTSSLYDNEHDWRVVRGGSWYFNTHFLRSVFRGDLGAPGERNFHVGLRLSRM